MGAAEALAYIVNVSGGKVLLNIAGKTSVVIAKNQALPQAFPLSVLNQSDEFMKFYSKGLLKLVSDLSQVSSPTPEAPRVAPVVPEIIEGRQIDDLNDRIRAGESPFKIDAEAGKKGGPVESHDPIKTKPTPETQEEKVANLQVQATEASKKLKEAMETLSEEVVAAGGLVVETKIDLPGPVVTSPTSETVPPVEEGVGRPKSIDLKGEKVDEDFPTAVIPPTSQDAISMIKKEPKAMKSAITKSRDIGLLREITYALSDLELRRHAWNRVKTLDKDLETDSDAN